jgi:hypothetical protein
MKLKGLHALTAACAFAPLLALPIFAQAATVANPSTSPQCMANTAFFNPQLPPSIVLPAGFTASVFVSGLNMPTGIAFLGNASSFQVFVLESGHGLPSVCNDETLWPGGVFDTNNPFTPDILVFNQNGRLIRGPLGKPTSSGGGFQGWVDLLVAGVDDKQRRRRSRQRWRREPVGYPMPGYHVEQQHVHLEPIPSDRDERLFPLQHAKSGGNNQGVLQLLHRSGPTGGLRRLRIARAVE